jgi:SHS2 domain-containing protein
VSLRGVAFIDHTADVGIDVEAPSLEQLLHRAALGMLALLRGEEEETSMSTSTSTSTSGLEEIPMVVRAEGYSRLMAAWLGEILYLHEVRGVDYVASELDRVGPGLAEGRIAVRAGGHAVREIKGVTYHELEVHRDEAGGWTARVIFDV